MIIYIVIYFIYTIVSILQFYVIKLNSRLMISILIYYIVMLFEYNFLIVECISLNFLLYRFEFSFLFYLNAFQLNNLYYMNNIILILSDFNLLN